MNKETYVIKIWSNVLLWDSWIDEKVIENITSQVNLLKNNWNKVLLVSSWAVALWKKKMWLNIIKWLTNNESWQIFSSVWQVSLMDTYTKYFDKHNIIISQALLTRRDFSDRDRYNSMKRVLFTSLEQWIVPIINENDVLSEEELDFSDNDELWALLAAMIGASKLIILSNIDWLYDRFPNWTLIKKVEKIDQNILSMVWNDKSSMWKWWMESKLKIAKMMMDLWIKMYIANWKKDNTIELIYNDKNPWTLFESKEEKKVDSLRKWLKAGAVATWKIQVSTIIADLLKSWKRASLLEIWVEQIDEEFLKWDVVWVWDLEGFCIWYWVAKINSNEIDKNSGERKIVIHTDYFINL